jgi:hypothetical protein
VREWQVTVWLKFISKGDFMAARLFYEVSIAQIKKRKQVGLGPDDPALKEGY